MGRQQGFEEVLPEVSGNLRTNLNISQDKVLPRTLCCLFFKALKFIVKLQYIQSVVQHVLIFSDNALGICRGPDKA